jgi:photosystem II stability/assembly factor-like uncharacterized protein
MRLSAKGVLFAIGGFTLAFAVGLSIVWLKYWNRASVPTSIVTAAIRDSNNQPTFLSSVISLGIHEDLDFIQLISDREAWVGNHKGAFYRIDAQGARLERIERRPQGYVSSIYFSSESSGWLLSQQYDQTFDRTKDRGFIFHTEDGGSSWVTQLATEARELLRISFASAQEGWVIGTKFAKEGQALDAETFLLYTADGGSTWTDVSDGFNRGMMECSGKPRQLPGAISAIRSGSLFVMSEHGWALTTSDGGAQWRCDGKFNVSGLRPEQIVPAIDQSPRVLARIGGNHGTLSMLAVPANDGSWSARSLSNIFLKDALYLSKNELIACGYIISAAKSSEHNMEGIALLSVDDGMSWTIIYRSSDITSLNALAATSSGQIWAVGSNGALVRFDRKND